MNKMKKDFTMSLYANKESLKKDKKEFLSKCSIVVYDDSRHRYIIPYNKLQDWEIFVRDDDTGNEPCYAERIDGAMVVFENYTLL